MREAGWAKAERNRLFDAVLAALKQAALPCVPLRPDFHRRRILVIEGPSSRVHYFVWARPAPNLVAAGLYVPKGKYGSAVHAALRNEVEALSVALGGGEVLEHKPVQREFRHYVERTHWFSEKALEDAVRWCVSTLSGAKKFIDASKTLNSKAELRKLREQLLAPTDDPVAFDGAVASLLASGEIERPKGNEQPEKRPSPPGERFVRNPKVAAFVLARAGSRCEACQQKAPFERDDGRPFLEVHHLRHLASGGPDTVANTIAVCPNCHRRLHFGVNRESLTSKLLAMFAQH